MRSLTAALIGACSIIVAVAPARAQDDGARREDKTAVKPAKKPKLTKAPALIEGAEPIYPPEAEKAGLEADVNVRIAIDATGAVTDATVPTPVGNGFDEAAIAAAKQYKFSPAEFDGGTPGPIVVETTIHFRMTVEEQPATQPEDTDHGAALQPPVPLTGVVKERGTRSNLVGATVALVPLAAGAAGPPDVTSGDGGRFTTGAPPGKYKVVVLLSGYERFTHVVELTAGEAADIKIYLRPVGGSPYETTVEADTEKTEVTKHPLSRHELTTVPGTFGDPVRVILSLPGLARSPFSTGLLLIRGSDPNQSGVYIDGHQVPLLFHFFGGPSILNPEFLDGLNLYPGGFPVRFGGVIGGVVAVDTRPSKSDGIHGAAKVDLIDSSAYLRAPVTKDITVAAAVRRSYIDLFLPLVVPKTTQVSPVYYDYQLRTDIALPAHAKLAVTFLGSDDSLHVSRLNAMQVQTFGLDQHTGFNRLWAVYTQPVGVGDLKLTISPSIGHDDLSFAAGANVSLHLAEDVVDFRERVVGNVNKRMHLDTGIDFQGTLTTVDLNVPRPTQTENPLGGERQTGASSKIQRSGGRHELGAYAEFAWDAGHGVKLIPAMRADAWLLGGERKASIDPRLVTRWQVKPKTALKAYVGLFHQAPSQLEIDVDFGNPKLGLERAVHYGAGVEQRLDAHTTVETELYYVDRSNLSSRTDAVSVEPDGTVVRLNYDNAAVSHTYGAEVLLRREITRNFYGWLSYTLTHTIERDRPDEASHLAPLDQTHNLIAVASYRTRGGWEFGGRAQYATGRQVTNTIGGTLNTDSGDYTQVESTSKSRLPAFFQIDVRAEKTWTYQTWSLGLYLDIINVTNNGNVEATQWDYRFVHSAAINGLPIVPTIGIEGHW